MNEDNGTKLPLLPDVPPEDGPPAAPNRKLIWIGAAVAGVLAVAIVLTLVFWPAPEPEQSGVRLPASPPSTAQPAAPAPGEPPVPETPTPAPQAPGDGYKGFEETLGVPLERVVRQVDYALVETLLLTGYNPQAMAITDVRLQNYHDEQYHYQALTIELEGAPDRFLTTLEQSLQKWAPEARLLAAGDTWQVAVVGQVTHQLTFTRAEPQAPVSGTGMLSVVIDDMGRSVTYARHLLELPFPVTFSVLPYEPHTAEVAKLAADGGHELLLHLPMEPKAWPQVNPGQGALFTTMDKGQIEKILAEDLARVPGAVGANNHMGSKFTQTGPAMAVVMHGLKARNMFFLDSLTVPKSVGAREGRAAGLPVYKRNIFLDNIRDAEAILRQLEKAERIAAQTGQAVAIGHPYPETLAALKTWGERHDRGVRVVPVRELNPLQP